MSRDGSTLSDRQLQRIMRALSDPQRFEILQRIAADSELACKALVAQLPITQATISHHLKELSEAGLIHCRRAGQCVMLTADQPTLRAYLAELQKRLDPTLPH
jgi:ArsR family transcriptional regulator, arsenate/arsenite/antimonite-responsive transcriptional repressor